MVLYGVAVQVLVRVKARLTVPVPIPVVARNIYAVVVSSQFPTEFLAVTSVRQLGVRTAFHMINA